MSRINDVERKIHEHLVAQVQRYDLALPVAQKLANEYDTGQDQQDQLSRLDEMMREAFSENHHLSELMAAVNDIQNLAPETRCLSGKLAKQISVMIQFFDAIENRAKAIRKRLAPELNASLQARKMQSAYTRS